MTKYWEQDTLAPRDTWWLNLSSTSHCYISQYESSKDYYWQTKRGAAMADGIEPFRVAAMRAAEEASEIPVDEFQAMVIAKLEDRIADIRREIARIENEDLS